MSQLQADESKPVPRHRVEIKLSEAQKDLIGRGAAASGQGISEFVRSAAIRAANDALKR